MEEGSVEIGDYVLLHIGFIMSKIDEEDAMESLKVYQEIIEKLDEQERQALILESDNCPNREVV
jgi:hydrogenase expression/formation protein HypC